MYDEDDDDEGIEVGTVKVAPRSIKSLIDRLSRQVHGFDGQGSIAALTKHGANYGEIMKKFQEIVALDKEEAALKDSQKRVKEARAACWSTIRSLGNKSEDMGDLATLAEMETQFLIAKLELEDTSLAAYTMLFPVPKRLANLRSKPRTTITSEPRTCSFRSGRNLITSTAGTSRTSRSGSMKAARMPESSAWTSRARRGHEA